MAVKLVAVDMDGTFLYSRNDYNRERFSDLYQQMKAQGVHFVVASGNQYYQLRSFFPEIADEISFVAENGAYVVHQNQEVFCGEWSREDLHRILDVVGSYDVDTFIVCGRNSAYVLETMSDEAHDFASIYYHRLQKVEDFYHLDDTIFKIALNFDIHEVEPFIAEINAKMSDVVAAVSSGHGSVDLIVPGNHKASGIVRLQELLGVSDGETAAFGDGGNDLEMLKHVAYGYAMANASDAVKQAAKYHTDSNDDEGVLNAIEYLLTI